MAKVPKFVKSFFFLFTVAFAVWMLFVDVNDLRSQYRLGSKLRSLEAEKKFYEQQIKEVNLNREELLTNDQQLEEVAREKYLMKKPEEDVYVIVRE
ncbi:MAG: septum formation initiator family protein [Tunicatimonas sp.]